MKIAMIASEATPFSKTGGLADVIGTLSVALARLGHELSVVVPAYRSALQGDFKLTEIGRVSVPLNGQERDGIVLEAVLGHGATVYLIRADEYFDRDFLYGGPDADYSDNAERFTFFSR